MFTVIFVLMLVGAILLAIAAYIFGGKLIQFMAKQRFLLAPVPRPGTFSFLITGENLISRVVPNITEITTIGPRDNPEFRPGKNDLGFFGKFGAFWVGPFAKVLVKQGWEWYEFHKTEAVVDGATTFNYKIIRKTGDVSEFFRQFRIPVKAEGLEIKGNIQVNIYVDVRIEYLFPVRAFFSDFNPFGLIETLVISTVRAFVADWEFDGVKALHNTSKELSTLIHGLNYQLMPMGIKIIDYNIVQVDGVGPVAEAVAARELARIRGNAAIEEAEKQRDRARIEANRDAEVRIIAAEAEATALQIRGNAERAYLEQTVIEPCGGPGPAVAEVLKAKAVTGENSKLTAWFEGGGVTGSIPLK